MSELVMQSSDLAARPLPNVNVTIRPGVMSDVPFVDSLQKMHTKQVGWMPTAQLEGHIAGGNVLIAEERHEGTEARRHEGEPTDDGTHSVPSSLRASVPIGYCLFKDRYFKREDVGIIYQLNVAPGKQRGLIGASLIKAAFERSAYGVKLFCCWCAQDIEANHFWESIGFVPLAFRAGSRGKTDGGARREGRVHIFWQRRIRAGDTQTAYWYPSETSGGALRENHIVLPIPPGTHWSDAKPVVLPGAGVPGFPGVEMNTQKALEGESEKKQCRRPAKKVAAPIRKNTASAGGLRFAPLPEPKAEKPAKPAGAKREKREKQRNDPKYIAAARELRDRWLEQVNAQPLVGQGMYDVTRAIDDQTRVETVEPMKLPAAA